MFLVMPVITVVRLSETSVLFTATSPSEGAIYPLWMLATDTGWTVKPDPAWVLDSTPTEIDGLTAGATYIFTAYISNGLEKSLSSPVRVITLTADEDDGTPDGVLSRPLHYLRETIAASETFRNWVGATTGTEEENLAAARLRVAIIRDSSGQLPIVTIGHGDQFGKQQIAGGLHNHLRLAGSLSMTIDAAVAAGDTDEIAAYKFENKVGAILDEMEAVAGTGGYLDISGWEIKDGPYFCPVDERDNSDNAVEKIQMDILIFVGQGG